MHIQPLGNRVVVKLTKKETTSASGIIISTEEKNEQARGEVISIGAGQGSEENVGELGLTLGDVVLFGKYAGEEVEGDEAGVVYKILNGKDILAILK